MSLSKYFRVLTATVLVGACVFGGSLVLAPSAAADTISDGVCEGISLSPGACDSGANNEAGGKVTRMIQLVINVMSMIVGVASIIMIILGGFRYITSGGDSSSVSSAKNTILYAVIGLAVAALAQFIVRFVFTKVTQ